MPARWLKELERDGAALVEGVVPSLAVPDLLKAISPFIEDRAGSRSLYRSPLVRELATLGALGQLARQAIGNRARAVRVLFFDKQPGTNWKVPWHQDLTIAVATRAEVAGYTAWSEKSEIPHVQPPASVLEQMVAVRLHLDPCGVDNGPLRISPGTHVFGRLPKRDIESIVQRHGAITLTAAQGDAILMRPLCLHASSTAKEPSHRRVLHIEYATAQLAPPLDWHLGWTVGEP